MNEQLESLVALIRAERTLIATVHTAPTPNGPTETERPARLNPINLSPQQWEDLARYLIKKEDNTNA